MSPTAKFNGLLATITVTAMFLLISYGVPYLNQMSLNYPLALTGAAVVSSAGLYRILSLGMSWCMGRSERLKGFILGPYYMHGTWVGCFHGHGGHKRFMVEHYIQDLESLVITGRSFTDERKPHGYWESESTTIDARKGRILFTYKFDVLTRQSSLFGIHSSLFERDSAYSAPKSTSGFAHDLNDETRISVSSIKISSALLSWDEALAKAASIYNETENG
ncbi:hypothetical protein [Pseudomonas sp. B26(2017)]|uniref:hypothetical protein n=1 Tax=Pseudomonas sp. B26(2017) TaxID=1981732 RepID=UPI00111C111B|nr:hypothetical protein [Pseudomonas sp. B26(2017)]